MLIEVSDKFHINATHVCTIDRPKHHAGTGNWSIAVSMVNGEKLDLKFRSADEANTMHGNIVNASRSG